MYTPGATLIDVRASFAAKSTSITRTFDYDHAGRLMKVWHQVNETPKILLVENEYNELGQLITKKLHSENEGTSFKQHVDMRYNIRGWLTRINNADLTPDQSNDPRDHFGMNLSYNEAVSTLNNTPQFNGNISAMRWSNSQGFDDVKENAYAYTYDAMNRIAGANFRQKQSSGWGLPQHKDADDNTVTSEAFTETGYKYDLNGNLQELARKGKDGISMDVLSYDYGSGAAKSNKLLSVSDAGDIRQGFADGNIGSEDYTYDNNGSMVADKNKDISAITYNHLNLPVQVTKVSGEYIKYFYDATGRKLCQQVFNSSSALTKQTDYTGELFYENDTLKFINHEEGRVVMTGTTPEYQYHLKDHLGNVRLTFTTKVEVASPVATMETAKEASEQNEFLYYDEAVKVNFELFDHTNAGTTYYSTRLNGTANERTGLAKSLSVMPGDVIKAQVYAKYLDTNTANWSAAVSNLVTSIANGTAAATGTYIDGGAIGSTGGTVNPFAGILDKGNETDAGPKAYLNYLVFDRDYKVLDGGFVRITEAAKESGTDGPHELLSKELIIKKPGYVYLYLSNDNVALGGSPVEVYFDDFNVEHTKSPVVQADDYYSFGLTFNSYTRERSVKNKYLYNAGSELQDDLGLSVYTTLYRTLDLTINRWWQIDPKVDSYYSWTPYNFAYDNPVSHNDPMGDCEECYKFLKGVVNGAIQTGKNLANYIPEKAKELGNAYSAMAKGDIKPALKMAATNNIVGVVAGQLKRPITVVKEAAKGNTEAVGKQFGAQLTEGAIALATGAISTAKGSPGPVSTATKQAAEQGVSNFPGKAVVVGAELPNGASTVAPSGPFPSTIAPNLEAAANQLGGVGTVRNGNTVGCCAEFHAANELLLANPEYMPGAVNFTPAVRPRTGEVIEMCQNCKDIFGKP